ncbi:hypothetical protein E2C01_058109 [Portunus trituberculatus]|uniref:Uncharacterized protein n=1 Tax=Portunus trituberculatus TaxID=210409 RepID=A0A5B7GVB5_PORTR|nr:hypothetical protein [Portunus trituberculatus]
MMLRRVFVLSLRYSTSFLKVSLSSIQTPRYCHASTHCRQTPWMLRLLSGLGDIACDFSAKILSPRCLHCSGYCIKASLCSDIAEKRDVSMERHAHKNFHEDIEERGA